MRDDVYVDVQEVLAWPAPDWMEQAGDSGGGCSSA